jgi:hypothetical protein
MYYSCEVDMTFKEIEKKLAENSGITQKSFMILLVNIMFGMWRDYREINGARSE